MWQLTHISHPKATNWGYGFGIRDYNTLYRKDRTEWGLFQLGKDPAERAIFLSDLILQHLHDHLGSGPKTKSQRIDQETYKCVSDLVAVERMMALVLYHLPRSRPPTTEEMTRQTFLNRHRQAWNVFFNTRAVPEILTLAELGLGTVRYPLEQFRIPRGRKDEKWLEKNDSVRQALRTLWTVARQGYQKLLEPEGISQRYIDPQLEQMKQGGSPEQQRQTEFEKQRITERIKAAKMRAPSAPKPENVPHVATSGGPFPERYVTKPLKEKIKARPQGLLSVESSGLPTASLQLDEIRPPVLYLLKSESTLRIVTLLFPDPNDNPAKDCIDWLDFVTAMTDFGFQAEKRGGSAFSFRGKIKPAKALSDSCFRSINVHKTHPTMEIGPILLQSIGRTLNRRYGWQRENFQRMDGV